MGLPRVIGILAICALSLTVAIADAMAQGKKINKQQLVGTWKLVATENIGPDGSKLDIFGQSPKGILVFDRSGNYSLTIVRSDLPKFAASTADKGTAEESKAVVSGMIAHFGTYSLDEADRTLTTRIEGSSFPNLAGGEQKRIISSLTKDELKYTNPTAAVGGTKAEVVWRRAK